ncbi:MAG: hypothetical protein EOO06_03300 [Chitinophagaceae bacterium]|nr:MAG: hypothetical protein EOO06_03300 [Chitinophagaceae bacterium]
MPKYLRTSGISAAVEQLIRESKERLYIISPYLKLSDSMRELLNDKEREKAEVRMIFGKQELSPAEMSFLQSLKYVRLYFSKNLHAKCYLNEKSMVICSMNLYEFSQQNNREMGVLFERELEADRQVYEDAWKDIESILNNAVDFSYVEAPKVEKQSLDTPLNRSTIEKTQSQGKYFSVTALAKELGISNKELTSKIEKLKWIERKNDEWVLTALGKAMGATVKSGQYGEYIAYPEKLITDLK